MEITQTELPGVLVIKPTVHEDARGFFMESWNKAALKAQGIECDFIQDNHARSEEAGVLRGMHFQAPPHAQAKLVRVTRGAVYDVVADLRVGSPAFGQHFGLVLSAENKLQLLVPKGFAHGYLTLEPGTEFQYKVDAYYSREADGGIMWNDPDLGIRWPGGFDPILSPKDRELPLLADFDSPFIYDESTGRD